MGKKVDLTGKRFGRLTVLHEATRPEGVKHRTYWKCQCDCGNTLVCIAASLNAGKTKSCGCLKRETASKTAFEQQYKHGFAGTRLYNVWSTMKARCYTSTVKTYSLYGGRGIKVCDEWRESFVAFREWAIANGYDETAPRGSCTLDRIDNDGNYCPENCRWVNITKQANNRRSNRMIEFNGKMQTASDWAKEYGLNPSMLYDRLYSGWTVEKALTTKPQGDGRNVGN